MASAHSPLPYSPIKVATVRPLDLFARDQWSAVNRVHPWRGAWLVAHAWAVIALTIAATLALWAIAWPLGLIATPVALAIIGGRQLGLAILMHDAAHGMLKHRRWNEALGQYLCASPVGADLLEYRAYHLKHHRYTQTEADPDLGLSAPFPVTAASLRRKFLRDLTGRTFIKQRWAQVRLALAAGSASAGADSVFIARALLRFLAANLVLVALSLAVTGTGWAYALWFAALATSFPLFLRVRNIAEHACVTSDAADPFSHARTTRANWAERATVAPYWVNYHAEHHMFMGVPCHALPRVHAMLGREHPRMVVAPGYRAVLSEVIRRAPRQ